ncbi:MAG TPA: hypothetical protein VLX91_01315 [Candidatus Acidoferrales bacterium]|nr:hypothetical protein [Candidatus Acidoferrales bacterium]
MKIPIKTQCPKCGRELDLFIRLDEAEIHDSCECGEALNATLQGFTVGDKLLSRGRYEFYHNSDYSLCIVFSATAMECELSRLYFKWTRATPPFPTDSEIEESLRRFRNVASRIDEVTKLMKPIGITGFVAANTAIANAIKKDFPSFDMNDLSQSFQRELFWPRNRILHLGQTGFDTKQAEHCFNIASLGLTILQMMENQP